MVAHACVAFGNEVQRMAVLTLRVGQGLSGKVCSPRMAGRAANSGSNAQTLLTHIEVAGDKFKRKKPHLDVS